jgi:hypothetical protein
LSLRQPCNMVSDTVHIASDTMQHEYSHCIYGYSHRTYRFGHYATWILSLYIWILSLYIWLRTPYNMDTLTLHSVAATYFSISDTIQYGCSHCICHFGHYAIRMLSPYIRFRTRAFSFRTTCNIDTLTVYIISDTYFAIADTMQRDYRRRSFRRCRWYFRCCR